MAPGDAGNDVVAQKSVERSYRLDHAVWYLAWLMFRALHCWLERSQLDMINVDEFENWSEVSKWQLGRGRLIILLHEVILRVVEMLGVIHPGRRNVQVVEVAKNWMDVTQEVACDMFASHIELVGLRSVLFSNHLEPKVPCSKNWEQSASDQSIRAMKKKNTYCFASSDGHLHDCGRETTGLCSQWGKCKRC